MEKYQPEHYCMPFGDYVQRVIILWILFMPQVKLCDIQAVMQALSSKLADYFWPL